MKKLYLTLALILICMTVILANAHAASSSDRWQNHEYLYVSLDHATFCILTALNLHEPDFIDYYNSITQSWWGDPIPYPTSIIVNIEPDDLHDTGND